jgi:hypothetical protein
MHGWTDAAGPCQRSRLISVLNGYRDRSGDVKLSERFSRTSDGGWRMSSDGGDVSSSVSAIKPRALVAWKEGTRTRAAELAALNAWVRRNYELTMPSEVPSTEDLHSAIIRHLDAALDATTEKRRWWERSRMGARMEGAISNLDAAEADLLQIAPAAYVLGQMPSVLNHVQRYLKSTDPRRKEIEGIAKKLGVNEPSQTPPLTSGTPVPRHAVVDEERGKIVSAVRGASSVALREQTRLRSFRNVVVATTIAMAVVAIALGVIGWRSPDTIPLCFAPQAGGLTTVVCPTEQSGPVPTPGATPSTGTTGEATTGDTATEDTTTEDIDELVSKTAARQDIPLVEFVGLTAAGIAAAGAIRRVRGSSEPYGVPIALALLKLPTGAVTALLGLLLMRGGFIPGLSALDTSAQILAWAIVFGYAQQLFTRLVDQQAHSVLDAVRGGNKRTE